VSYDQQKLLAGHLLRHIGFGPSATDVSAVLSQGWDAYINSQLNPQPIDSTTAAKFGTAPDPNDAGGGARQAWQRRWYSRMLYSPWQLQEKMTLNLHEHFAVSDEKVQNAVFMHDYEEFLRTNALGSFRDLLIGLSTDKAMLVWLDNNNNNGAKKDSQGKPISPNINFARELLQLFTLGTTKLDRYGSPTYDANGVPIPAYTEADIKAVARALTGWQVKSTTNSTTNITTYSVVFNSGLHDTSDKLMFGVTIKGQTGSAGANELPQVIDLIMRQSTHSRFIAKILIQKLATETPSGDYINYVGQVYARNSFNLKYTIQAILTYPDFTSDAVVRNQYRNPIEEFIGALRSLKANIPPTSTDNFLLNWTGRAAQQVYFPPSVFSFYPPGQKKDLVNTALTTYRDKAANDFVTRSITVSPGSSTKVLLIDFAKLASDNKLTTPDLAVDYLSDALLCAPLENADAPKDDPKSVRTQIISYMAGSVSTTKLKGAAWLIMCSPDFQRN
jgi:uncharacterized protein (DUF1800 family)